MSWKATFEKGVACFRRGDLQEALNHMNQAAELQSANFTIYDSRAAVYEKLGNLKAALLDSKRVIDLAPDRWQGYARSARLFNALKKHGAAIKMADHALSRLRGDDLQRLTQLTELREQAVIAQAAAEKLRSQTTYLLGKLPMETLVEMFKVLINEDHTWAVRLSHVCGHWRRILLNTPSAWHTLVLSNKHPLRKAKLWMDRTQGRIAKLSFFMSSSLDEIDVLSQLKGLSWNDLSSIHISGRLIPKLHRMLSDIFLPHAFSNLEELSLHDLDDPDQLMSFLSGPKWKLKSLYIGGSFVMKDECWQHINQLTELHLCGPVVTSFSLMVLRANPSLEKLVLDCPTVHIYDVGDAATPVIMNNLKSVSCRNTSLPLLVLSNIVAPSIMSLSLHSAPIGADTILRLAPRPSLVELRICSCNLDRSTLPTVLPDTPNLETLQINSVGQVVNDVLEFLTPKSLPLPCPALKHVDFSGCSDLTTSNIYAFVKSRLQHGLGSDGSTGNCAVIESLTVDGCPKIEPEMLPWFRSKVARFSCVYMTKKDLKRRR